MTALPDPIPFSGEMEASWIDVSSKADCANWRNFAGESRAWKKEFGFSFSIFYHLITHRGVMRKSDGGLINVLLQKADQQWE